MECPSLSRRVSTRPSVLSSSAQRHHSTPNASHLPPSSRPTTPIVISPKVSAPIGGSKLISDPHLSTLVTSALQASPISSLCPALSSTQLANCDEGQFSDADSDQERAEEAHRKKRAKPNSVSSTQESLSLRTKSNVQGASSNDSSHHNGVDRYEEAQEDAVESELGGRLTIPSNTPSTASIQQDLRSTRPSKPSTPPAATPTPLTYDSRAQLPIATRRLAMLAGIPESSQAIIQSTLSLPTSRSNPSNSHPYASTARIGVSSRGTTSLPTSDSLNCSGVSSNVSKDYTSRHSNSLSSADAACSSPRDHPNVPARSLATTPRPLTTLATRPSDCGSSQAPKIPSTGPTSNRRGVKEDARLAAPRYGGTSHSSEDFTMPVPGSFSIRAPSSSQLLRSYDPALSSEASEMPNWAGSQLEGYEESSEFDASSQPPSTGPAHSPSASSSYTGMMPTLSSHTPGNRNKRKAGTSKAGTSKAASQTGESDYSQADIELVKPPPTINGKVSHGRKVPVGYIKRTPNSFLMFRSHVINNKLLPPGVENDNRQISRVVSGLWAGLSEEDLRSWQTASRELRAAARAQNPGMKHAPNQKRKDVVRRRRSGQLPGETPEQRVEREKASAAALAKTIINSRGERLDKQQPIAPSARISVQPSTSTAIINRRHTPREEASRPEFRAPIYLNPSSGGQAVTPRSEYAESTLTTSPAADARRSLTRVPESDADKSSVGQAALTPRAAPTGKQAIRYPNPRNPLPPEPTRTMDHHTQAPQQRSSTLANLEPRLISQASQSSQSTIRQRPLSPALAAGNLSEVSLDQLGSEPYSGVFSHMDSGFDVSENFPNTFSNEMLRSLGFAASDLNLDMPATGSLPGTSTGGMHDISFPEKSFAIKDDCRRQDPSFWSQESGFSNLGNSTSAEYPFRDSTVPEDNLSQITAPGNAQATYPRLSQTSPSDATNPLEFSSLIDTSYTDPGKSNCDVLNFESMYLNYQSSSMANQALEDACQSLTTNIGEAASGSTNGEPTINQEYPKGFWVNS
ncbi:hypothetical protein Pst134EA_027868 [Puccinia striiformis f. sp. tritici]|uniref:HMG box domain-containing protein n=2 Tax=Puccinia striiformis f. sp. tritici PST-78 TaxID=1165861 RepID=A0A0L0VHC6_9BASI|nr:hypothetical protein Pst134EA_027868 [Puccinia striiformis f. sp. tritici]KAH9448558.1 hypothetical protein Pst134EA_027868 [Puccinia striiformis f. sp. tritici]KAI9608020.1 hypothetical protein H4Q26_005473 [Puccinia striiformis f. sp. tritici PST-130]KNE98621.1 hypothetical protein PSTG_08173 [Puccinia striiformis f. sp. tritici PST-78]